MEDQNNENPNSSNYPRSKNDLKLPIKTLRQLDRLDLDLESPKLRLACHNLGISPRECLKKRREEFYSPGGVDEDVVELRFKHFRARQMDTINRVLEERRQISKLL